MSIDLEDFKDQVAVALRAHAAGQVATVPVRRRRPLWPAASLVAAAAVAALLLLLPGSAPEPASAAELLRSAASAAEREAPLAPGEYLYVRRRFTARQAVAAVHEGVEERWTRADGSGRVLVRDRAGRVVEDAKLPAGEFWIGTETISASQLASPNLGRLVERQARRTIAENPRFDPEQLRAFTAYAILRDVLGTPSSARLRAEAYRTLAAAPGLRVVSRDGGRDTVAVRVGDVELRSTIVPADGRLVAIERRLLRRSTQIPGPPGIVDHSVVVERGAVGSMRERP